MSADKLLDDSVLHIRDGIDLKSTNCVKPLGVDVELSLSLRTICQEFARKEAGN